MNVDDEQLLGLYLILYPILLTSAGIVFYEILRRTVRVCWRNRKEWLA
jgi:hypothetical protein